MNLVSSHIRCNHLTTTQQEKTSWVIYLLLDRATWSCGTPKISSGRRIIFGNFLPILPPLVPIIHCLIHQLIKKEQHLKQKNAFYSWKNLPTPYGEALNELKRLTKLVSAASVRTRICEAFTLRGSQACLLFPDQLSIWVRPISCVHFLFCRRD